MLGVSFHGRLTNLFQNLEKYTFKSLGKCKRRNKEIYVEVKFKQDTVV